MREVVHKTVGAYLDALHHICGWPPHLLTQDPFVGEHFNSPDSTRHVYRPEAVVPGAHDLGGSCGPINAPVAGQKSHWDAAAPGSSGWVTEDEMGVAGVCRKNPVTPPQDVTFAGPVRAAQACPGKIHMPPQDAPGAKHRERGPYTASEIDGLRDLVESVGLATFEVQRLFVTFDAQRAEIEDLKRSLDISQRASLEDHHDLVKLKKDLELSRAIVTCKEAARRTCAVEIARLKGEVERYARVYVRGEVQSPSGTFKTFHDMYIAPLETRVAALEARPVGIPVPPPIYGPPYPPFNPTCTPLDPNVVVPSSTCVLPLTVGGGVSPLTVGDCRPSSTRTEWGADLGQDGGRENK